jgi:hypothetical protein
MNIENKLKTSVLAIFTSTTLSVSSETFNQSMKENKYKLSDELLMLYLNPKWFLDARFGIRAHWGQQAVPRYGIGMSAIFTSRVTF